MFKIKKNRSIFIGVALMCMSYTTARIMKDPDAPLNYTGAPKATSPVGQVRYCSNSGCHADFALNTAGGSVVASGLPTSTYTPGQTYTFSIMVNHSTADRTNWGFAIKAVNTVDNDVVGTFTTTNANATVKGTVAGKSSELSHSNAPTSAASNTFTFSNLKWTAPASPGVNDANIKFYIVGVAGDHDGSEAGDYVYSTVVSATIGVLPVTLSSFTVHTNAGNAVNINWQTAAEINTDYFEIEASNNSTSWQTVTRITATGNASTPQSYFYTDHNLPASGTVYYRLKIADKNGAVHYSPVQVVKLQQSNAIVIEQVAPQEIVNGNIVFKASGKTVSAMLVMVADFSGRLLYKNNIAITGENKMIEIPAAAVSKANGMLLITFKAEGFEKTFRQLVQH